MVRIIIALLFCFPVALSAQTYQQLSEKAIECIEKDSWQSRFCSTVPLSTWKRGGRTVLIPTIAECLMKTSRIKRLC